MGTEADSTVSDPTGLRLYWPRSGSPRIAVVRPASPNVTKLYFPHDADYARLRALDLSRARARR